MFLGLQGSRVKSFKEFIVWWVRSTQTPETGCGHMCFGDPAPGSWEFIRQAERSGWLAQSWHSQLPVQKTWEVWDLQALRRALSMCRPLEITWLSVQSFIDLDELLEFMETQEDSHPHHLELPFARTHCGSLLSFKSSPISHPGFWNPFTHGSLQSKLRSPWMRKGEWDGFFGNYL